MPKVAGGGGGKPPWGGGPSVLARLAEGDREAARRLLGGNVRQFAARRDIVREGDPPQAAYLLVEGWACRYKTLPDGRRQILGFLIPGDLFDFNCFVLSSLDHSLGALNAVKAALIGPGERAQLMALPGVADALWRAELVTASIQREWTLNIGQRTASERIAHLICETFFRLRAAGLAEGGRCDFPITQTDMAEACGLTPVHVNRMVQALRADGLIVLRDKHLTVPNLPRLMRAGLFTPDYLHLDPAGGTPRDDG